MKRLIYTVNFGDYDYLLEPEVITPGWDYVVVTDKKDIDSKWTPYYFNENLPGWLLARKPKILLNEFFPDYDISIFVDAMYRVNTDLNKLIENKLSSYSDIALPQHNERHCVYEEIEACFRCGKMSRDLADKIISKYKYEGLQPKGGLTQCGFMIRSHHRKNLDEFNRLWYQETKFTTRDQISFMYICWKYNLISYNLFSVLELDNKIINITSKRKCKQ